MPEVKGYVACESGPRSTDAWVLTETARKQMAEQAVGLPVTVDFDAARVVGVVTSAANDRLGLRVTIEAPEGVDLPLDPLLGPAFTTRVVTIAPGQVRQIHEADILALSLDGGTADA